MCCCPLFSPNQTKRLCFCFANGNRNWNACKLLWNSTLVLRFDDFSVLNFLLHSFRCVFSLSSNLFQFTINSFEFFFSSSFRLLRICWWKITLLLACSVRLFVCITDCSVLCVCYSYCCSQSLVARFTVVFVVGAAAAAVCICVVASLSLLFVTHSAESLSRVFVLVCFVCALLLLNMIWTPRTQ